MHRVVARLLYVTGVAGDVSARRAARAGGTRENYAKWRPLLNLTAPVRVAVIDVAAPLGDLDCGRPEQPPYTAAWILVCQAGRPLGSIEIALHDPVITAAELEREVRGQLGDAW